MSGAAEPRDSFCEEDSDDSYGEPVGDEAEDELDLSTPSATSTIPSSPPCKKPKFSATITIRKDSQISLSGGSPICAVSTTTADKGVISNAGKVTESEGKAEKNVPTEEKGKRSADLDIQMFEDQE